MRLIDADSLEKALHNFFDGKVIDEPAYILRDVFCHIDNAPTVELTEEYDLPNTHIDVYSYRCGWNEALNRAGIALKSGIRPNIKGEKNE